MKSLAFLFLVCGSTAAYGGGITDRPGLFTPAASSKARGIIQSLSSVHEDITVDVYDKAPSPAYVQWANEHAPDNGVYIVISRNPGHLEVAVKHSDHFSPNERQHMADLLLTSFKQRKFDQGLLNALTYAQAQSGATSSATVPVVKAVPKKKTSEGVSWIWWVVLLPLVGWGLYKAIKHISKVADEEEILTPPPPVRRPVPRRDESWGKATAASVARPRPFSPVSHAGVTGFVAGAATAVILEETLRRDRNDARRKRESDDSDAADDRRRRDEETTRTNNSDSSSSSGSSDGGGFDSGSSGGGFDSGSSGGDF